MPRFLTCVSFGVACVLWLAGVGVAAPTSRPSETLLPDTTQGFFAISNVDTLNEHWNKTQLGHLMADPVMEPFTKDIRRQFDERWSNVHERLGLTLDDMKGVPGGDVAIGLIAPAPGKAALAIVIDVTGKLPQANEMLQKVTAAQLQRGAKRSELKVEGCPDAGHPVRLAAAGRGKGGRTKHAAGQREVGGGKERAPPAKPPRQAAPRKSPPARRSIA